MLLLQSCTDDVREVAQRLWFEVRETNMPWRVVDGVAAICAAFEDADDGEAEIGELQDQIEKLEIERDEIVDKLAALEKENERMDAAIEDLEQRLDAALTAAR
jgi:chromosome segregation ATPase